jgi:hypothetical protein
MTRTRSIADMYFMISLQVNFPHFVFINGIFVPGWTVVDIEEESHLHLVIFGRLEYSPIYVELKRYCQGIDADSAISMGQAFISAIRVRPYL